MSSSPAVSVVMPAYNAALWIREALESVLAQTYPVLEVLVVDDGSTDETARTAEAFGDRIRILSQPHRGVPPRNAGIEQSRGQLIAFLDADDLWDRSKLAKQVRAMQDQQFEWVVSDSCWLDATTGRIGPSRGAQIREGDILEGLLLGNFIVTSSTVVSRRALDAVGHFEETSELLGAEDWDLWMRLASKYPLGYVTEPLTTLRLHPSSALSTQSVERNADAQKRAIRRAVEREPLRLTKLRGAAISSVDYSAGVRLFRRGQLGEARSFFWRSWMRRPMRPEAIGYIATTFLGARGSTALVDFKRRLLGRRQP